MYERKKYIMKNYQVLFTKHCYGVIEKVEAKNRREAIEKAKELVEAGGGEYGTYTIQINKTKEQ